MTLDMRTVLQFEGLLYILNFAVVFILWLQVRNRFRGLHFWMTHFGITGLGFILIAFMHHLPAWISIVAANGLIALGYSLNHFGSLRFTGKKIRGWMIAGTAVSLGISIGIHAYYTFSDVNLIARIVNINIALMIYSLLNFLIFQYRVDPETQRYAKLIKTAFLLPFFILGARLIGLRFIETNDFMASGLYDTIMVLLTSLSSVILAFSEILMVNRWNVKIVKDGEREYAALSQDLAKTAEGLKKEIDLRIQTEKQFRDTLDNSPFCIQIYSKDDITVYINKAGLDLRGSTSLEDHLNTPQQARLTPESLKKTKQWEEDKKNNIPLPNPFTLDILHNNGEVRNLLGYQSEILWENEICTQVVFQDITDQKHAEVRERELQNEVIATNRMAAIGQMAAGIAHEVNNPLTWILGYADILMEENLPEETADIVQRIREGAQRVSSIMRRMLLFSRQRAPELTSVNINDIIHNTIELRSHDMNVNNITIDLDLDPGLPKTAVDVIQIQQVFLNIILNAETEMLEAHNGGNLSIKTGVINNDIRISFNDDGRGIPVEDSSKIFDPFFTTKEVGEGTGLGLSVSYGIITQHHGKIYAQNNLQGGATFIVDLPIVETQEKGTNAKVSNERDPRGQRNVLVVDDEENIRNYMNRILPGKGYKLDFADSGEKAREMITGNDYDIVLLDVKLPGISGIELLEMLRNTPDDITDKVIFITGDSMSLNTVSYIVTAEIPHINKPFKVAQLYTAMDHIGRKNDEID